MELRGAALEPGILLSFRIYVVVTAVGPAYSFNLWRLLDPSVSLPMQSPVLAINLLFTGFLLVYIFQPWFRQRLGTAFFPLALLLQAAHPIARYYFLMPDVQPALLEQYSVLSLARLSAHATIIVIFVAWQYALRWPLYVG